MKILLAIALSFISSIANATLVKITASGTVSADDFTVVDTATFCCTGELTEFSWSYESTFNFEDFFVPSWSSSDTTFILTEHSSTTVVNGKTAPEEFNAGTLNVSQRHNLTTYDASVTNVPYLISQISFTMGGAPTEAGRFLVTENLYISEMSIRGSFTSIYNMLDEATDIDTFVDALINEITADDLSYRFYLSDFNNQINELVAFAHPTEFDTFKIEVLNVNAPSQLDFLLIGTTLVLLSIQKRERAI